MTVGVNALYLIPGGVGGTEIYLRGLLKALGRIDRINRYVVFTNAETGADLLPAGANFVHAPRGVRARNRPSRILHEQFLLPGACAGIDVLFNPGFTAPVVRVPCPMVTVFHDLQHLRHPENFRWFDLPAWKVLLWASARRSAELLADSDATRADVMRYYGVAATTAQLAADDAFFEIAARRAPERFLLASSTLHPHKNLDGLLRTFAAFRREHPEFRLVVTGLRGFFTEQLETLRRELALEDSVEFTGWVAREELVDLFRRAWAFFYPSKFEGFGLPVAEALAAGVPAACSDIEPLRGIAGDAAVMFDPASAAGMLDAMRRVVLDDALRAELALRGPVQAAPFRWERTARITLEVLTRAARR